MTSQPSKHLCDDTMQLCIKQVVELGLVNGSGIASIAEPKPGLNFTAWVDGRGDQS